MVGLDEEARQILQALSGGDWLKAHRTLDGAKAFQLHGLDGGRQEVSRQAVEALLDAGLISSNQKFPAATFTLTAAGRSLANRLQSPPGST